MPITTPRVLIELNGADPLHYAVNLSGIAIDVLDWDELREEGEAYMSSAELIKLHDRWEDASPQTALSIRNALRDRGVELPAQYDRDNRKV